MRALALAGAICALAAFPQAAAAHGPLAPIASSYLARVTGTPAGLNAKAVDGDQRMWLDAAQVERVVVFDYRSAPYLLFSREGVAVNHNSAMYYLNQSPAQQPPPGLGPGRVAELARGHDGARVLLARWTAARARHGGARAGGLVRGELAHSAVC